MPIEFKEWPKTPRLLRNITITEKIDGTNACVIVTDEGEIHVQSRKRLITPEQDNYGFARWATAHADELRELGPGYHFGEWWGLGIQRGYGLDEKRFSLFNTGRWQNQDPPACCHVVPILATADFSQAVIETTLDGLREDGSAAAPGFMDPEGVVVYLSAARQMFKVTLENDGVPKSQLVGTAT
jgi:hypothetical protein